MKSKSPRKTNHKFAGYVDLNKETVRFSGKRLTEEGAEKLAKQISARRRGRPSLSSKNEESPLMQFRITKSKKVALKKRAKAENTSESELLRQAVDLLLASKKLNPARKRSA